MGTRQEQQFQYHLHANAAVGLANGSLNVGQSTYAQYGAGTTGPAGGTETRPTNTAYHPRIHT